MMRPMVLADSEDNEVVSEVKMRLKFTELS